MRHAHSPFTEVMLTIRPYPCSRIVFHAACRRISYQDHHVLANASRVETGALLSYQDCHMLVPHAQGTNTAMWSLEQMLQRMRDRHANARLTRVRHAGEKRRLQGV